MTGAKSNILEAIGNTPIVKLQKVARHVAADIYVKCEYLNPGGSMKDRVAMNIIGDAERRGLLGPGGTIVEATSGNTGMGLALVAALRGYACVFVMPDKMSQEKVAALRACGARVVICPTAVEPEDPRSYYQTAKRIVQETPGAFYANQYHNPANPEAHYLSTAPEIWEQTNGEVDVFVAGMGTGGTISGCGRFFKEKKPGFRLVGVDPIGSLYYEYVKTGRMTRPFAYYVEGIGEDFLPQHDEPQDRRRHRARRRQGVLPHDPRAGPPGGAVRGRQLGRGGRGRDQVRRDDQAQGEHPRAAPRRRAEVPVQDLRRQVDARERLPRRARSARHGRGAAARSKKQRPLITTRKGETVRDVIALMRDNGVSQMPVLETEGGRLAGIVTEVDLLKHLVQGEGGSTRPSTRSSSRTTRPSRPRRASTSLRNIFNDAAIVVVEEKETIVGIIAKIDLIEFLAERRRQ